MKTQNKTAHVALALALGQATSTAAKLAVFEFNEAAATQVTAATNSGTPGSLGHPNSGDNSYVTDGNGVAVFTAADPFVSVFRNETLLSPAATTGQYFLRVDFAGHTLASSATTKTFGYGFRDSATASNLVLRLTKNNSDSVRLDVFDGNNLSGGNNTSPTNVNFSGLSDSVGISAILAFDLENDTYDLYTSVGNTGAFTQTLTDVALVNGASLDNLDQFRYQVQSYAPGDTVQVDRLLVADTLADALDGDLIPNDFDAFTTAGARFLGFNNTDEPANGFSITGDGTATYTYPGSDLFRTRLLTNAIVSGKAYLRLDVLDYSSADDSSDNFQLGLRDFADNRVSLQFTSNSNEPQKRLRVLPSEGNVAGTPASIFSTPGLGDTFVTSAILEIDIDNDTYSTFAGSPGNYTEVSSDVSLGFDIGALEELRLGISAMDTDDSLSFDLVVIDDDFEAISNFGAVTAQGEIVISDSGISGGNFVASFTADNNVDVYRSLDLQSFGTSPIASNIVPGDDVVLDVASNAKAFYVLVPTGSPAP